MNGIITVQDGETIADKVLGYSMAWLVSRLVMMDHMELFPMGAHRKTPMRNGDIWTTLTLYRMTLAYRFRY